MTIARYRVLDYMISGDSGNFRAQSNFTLLNDLLSPALRGRLLKLFAEQTTLVEGRVGRRVDHYHKIRYDHHIYDEDLTRAIDGEFFGAGPGYARSAYHTISQKFGVDVKYREMWKLGYYTAEKRGFYNYHRDNFKMTDYRNVSIIIGLSDPAEYAGGALHFQELRARIKLAARGAVAFRSGVSHGVRPVTSGNRLVLIGFFFDDRAYARKAVLEEQALDSAYMETNVPWPLRAGCASMQQSQNGECVDCPHGRYRLRREAVASLMPCEACPESGRAAAYLGRSLQEVFMVCRSCVGSGGTEATMFSKAVITAVQLPICLCEGIAMTAHKDLATLWTLSRYSTWLSTTFPDSYRHEISITMPAYMLVLIVCGVAVLLFIGMRRLMSNVELRAQAQHAAEMDQLRQEIHLMRQKATSENARGSSALNLSSEKCG